jgi:hypothetical protein
MTPRSIPYSLALFLLADMGWLVAALTVEQLGADLIIIITSVLAVGTMCAAGWLLAERAQRGREALAQSIEASQAQALWWQQQADGRLAALQREIDAARDRAVMHSTHLDRRLDALATAEQLDDTQAQLIKSLSDWSADMLAEREPGRNGRPALVQVNGSRGGGHS